jgi:hypothetical protein
MPCGEFPVAWDHLIFHFSSQAVSRTHVNLVDLVGGFRENIRIFESEKELSEYTKETEKFFPKEDAADGGVLRALRRHILVPRDGRSRPSQFSQPGNSYHRHLVETVESIPFEGSNSFQGLQGYTWGLGTALPYNVILATCLQVRLARVQLAQVQLAQVQLVQVQLTQVQLAHGPKTPLL